MSLDPSTNTLLTARLGQLPREHRLALEAVLTEIRAALADQDKRMALHLRSMRDRIYDSAARQDILSAQLEEARSDFGRDPTRAQVAHYLKSIGAYE